jgi:hypothetical protein
MTCTVQNQLWGYALGASVLSFNTTTKFFTHLLTLLRHTYFGTRPMQIPNTQDRFSSANTSQDHGLLVAPSSLQTAYHLFPTLAGSFLVDSQGFLQKVARFEKRIGDEAGAETVKTTAIKWTQRTAAHPTGDEA